MLTDVKIRNAKSGAARVELPDGNGLVLRVSVDGRKAFTVSFRVAGAGVYDAQLQRRRAGPKRRLLLGYWPEMSLAQARVLASQARAKALSGTCPAGHMTDRPLTVEQLIGDYCRE